MVANEHFCMQLARRLGQRAHGRAMVAEVDILRVPDPVLCIRRFDRDPVEGEAGIALPSRSQPLEQQLQRVWDRSRDCSELRALGI